MKIHNPLFLSLALDAKSRIQEISVDDVKQKMENAKDTIFVDVREESEWQNGHLHSAIHISKGTLERDVEKIIPNLESQVVLYCSGGFRSAIAADSLKKMGYTRVSSMLGGTSAWIQAGHPLVKD